ncbi:WxL domain-containing protein [Lactococcus raffinolactis]|mgnify:FL=1|jgi:hypothetical protein|uniref:WxL domain-containing protein n=1 Tax=Pseudolactococcus raffinolactis TaxID=1366 RepID=UPI000BB46377|nr:WxL domain-containing protein [Lactococcus raffinolactis]ATC61239.1 hypothetical protein CMV25_04790 [Lactococcus raffinolactis]MBW9330791.1 WxL domain-containing protein [Lactococcus raffinolactis]MDG4961819.1 WxL domain-containing protein [Lactococcus raffinolactis]MDT2766131.1 WxL domain-containing protein [Lactococcus raffinolactis]MDT2789420.1 WxL domain-containing protein [Lactococcus raffinolactis]
MKSKKLLCPAVFLIVAIFLIGTVASADTQTSNVFASFKEDTSPINPKLPGKIGGGKSDPEAPADLLNPSKGPTIYTPIGKNELGIVQHPSIFNFGETILRPDSKRKDLVVKALSKNKDGTDFVDKYGDGSYVQYVTVYDGRTASDGWQLSASATELTDVAAVSKKLTGATISVANTMRWNNDLDAGKGANKNLTGSDFTLTTDGTPVIVMGTTDAKYESDIVFRSEDVALTIPKATIKVGNFASTVTWTLVAAATP